MIAKRILADKATSNMAKLVRYVVAAQGRDDPRSWQRTADYILDLGGDGERVGGVRVSNCVTDDPAMATIEILATQKANKRSKGDKSYHLVFSFPEGERPPLETLHAIEDALCNAIGLGDHQRISAVHIDTAHLHVHVAINKVHPTTLRNVEPYYDMPRLMEACERLEQQYDLQRTNHGLQEAVTRSLNSERSNTNEHRNDRDRYGEFDRDAKPVDDEHLRQPYAPILGGPQEAATLNSVRTLSSIDVVQFPRGIEVLLPRHGQDHVEQGRTQPADGVRWPGDGRSSAPGRTSQGVSGAAESMEKHSGLESFVGWTKREVLPSLVGVDSWEAIHAALGESGLTIKPHGAGLVIGELGGSRYVRASTVDRSLSLKALTAKFGEYKPPKFGHAPTPARTYAPRARQKHVDTSVLFRDFQRFQADRKAGRDKAMVKLIADHKAYAASIKSNYASKRKTLSAMRGARLSKAVAYTALAVSMRNDLAKQRELQAKQKKDLTAMYATPTWQTWLAQQAAAGNEQAVAVLRSREEKASAMQRDILTAPNAEAARNIVFRHMNPTVRKDGAMQYRTADGGVVVDRATQVHTAKATAGAAFVALSLASTRFAGQELIVEGTPEFKHAVAQAAALNGIDVRFADPAMEEARKHALRLKNPPQETPETAVISWIKGRNALVSKISDIDYHRLWTANDAGPVTYRGLRRMADGSEVLLFSKGGETLVKPSSRAVVAKALRLKVGDSVRLDERGRFVDTSRGRTR